MNVSFLRAAFGAAPFSCRQAAAACGVRSPYSGLARLKQEGAIVRVGRGRYRLSTGAEQRRLLSVAGQQGDDAASTVAAIAAARWEDWSRRGYVRRVGPRRFAIEVGRPAGRRLRVRRR